MIQNIVFAALMLTAGGLFLHFGHWAARELSAIIRTYKIVRRGEPHDQL